MPKVKRICKACGKSFEACHTPNPLKIARWFDVACSRECYQEYIRRVEAARAGEAEPQEAPKPESVNVPNEAPVEEAVPFSEPEEDEEDGEEPDEGLWD